MIDNLNNPIVFGVLASIITYYVLQNDKSDEKRRLSLKYSILVGLMVWFVGYYFNNSSSVFGSSGTLRNNSPIAQDIFTDHPSWN